MPNTNQPGVLYQDRRITCTGDGLRISAYYAPIPFPKRIPYHRIVGVETVAMGTLTGKWRIWGTARPDRWAHLDRKRPSKTTALVIDTGRFVKPFITPDDPERVRQIIEQHMTPQPLVR
jgi:hypothetical protein